MNSLAVCDKLQCLVHSNNSSINSTEIRMQHTNKNDNNNNNCDWHTHTNTLDNIRGIHRLNETYTRHEDFNGIAECIAMHRIHSFEQMVY